MNFIFFYLSILSRVSNQELRYIKNGISFLFCLLFQNFCTSNINVIILLSSVFKGIKLNRIPKWWIITRKQLYQQQMGIHFMYPRTQTHTHRQKWHQICEWKFSPKLQKLSNESLWIVYEDCLRDDMCHYYHENIQFYHHSIVQRFFSQNIPGN